MIIKPMTSNEWIKTILGQREKDVAKENIMLQLLKNF